MVTACSGRQFRDIRNVVTVDTKYFLSSLCHHCAITLLSLCHNCVITVLSLCHYCVTTVSSLCYHCVITVLSLCYHCVITVLSLCYHCVISVLSLCNYCVITVLSLCYHCASPTHTQCCSRSRSFLSCRFVPPGVTHGRVLAHGCGQRRHDWPVWLGCSRGRRQHAESPGR